MSQPAIEEPPLPYDAEVEYLESTGTQYIDLGITAEATDVIIIDYEYTALPNTLKGVFGSRSTSSAGKVTIYNGYTGGNHPILCALGSNSNVIINSTPITQQRYKIIVDIPNGSANINNTSYNVGTYTENTVNLHLFTISTGGTIMSPAAMKCYSLNIGTRMDLIPVRVGTVGYMYDRVSGQLLGNDGTGDFIVGPDIP